MEQRVVLSIDGRAGKELVQDRQSHLGRLRSTRENVHVRDSTAEGGPD